MSKKRKIGKILLLLVAIVMANIYFGCVHKHYTPGSDYQTKDGAEIKQQEQKMEELQKEIEELKKK